MSLTPLVTAGPIVIVHVVVALPKGTRRNRWFGWAWIALMAAVALSSFGIHGMRVSGPFGLIHLLSAFTLVMLAVAVMHALAGRIPAHRWTMIGLFAGALVITGLFTLLPGRVMHEVVFGT